MPGSTAVWPVLGCHMAWSGMPCAYLHSWHVKYRSPPCHGHHQHQQHIVNFHVYLLEQHACMHPPATLLKSSNGIAQRRFFPLKQNQILDLSFYMLTCRNMLAHVPGPSSSLECPNPHRSCDWSHFKAFDSLAGGNGQEVALCCKMMVMDQQSGVGCRRVMSCCSDSLRS